MTAALASAAFIIGCAGDGEGLDANGRPPGESGPPASGSDFQRIQDTIFTPICTQCHAGAAAPLGLRLDTGNSYALLVNVPSAQVPALRRVRPGDPNNSYIVQKIEGRAAVGARMPLGGPPLSQANIDLIRGWIAAGAPAASAPEPATAVFKVSSTVPAQGERAFAGTHEILLVLNADVDRSLLSTARVSLWAAGEAESVASVSVAPWSERVLLVRPNRPLAAGEYRLVIDATEAPALADVAANVLDGDDDGKPGGDYTLRFTVATEAHR